MIIINFFIDFFYDIYFIQICDFQEDFKFGFKQTGVDQARRIMDNRAVLVTILGDSDNPLIFSKKACDMQIDNRNKLNITVVGPNQKLTTAQLSSDGSRYAKIKVLRFDKISLLFSIISLILSSNFIFNIF